MSWSCSRRWRGAEGKARFGGRYRQGHAMPGEEFILRQVERDGFALLRSVIAAADVEEILNGLSAALGTSSDEAASIRSQAGTVYAARNVLALWPPAATRWRRPPLPEILAAILGPG